MEDAPFLLLLLSSIRFASSPQGFAAVERGFREGKPWESREGGRNVRRKRGPVWIRWEGGQRAREKGWAGWAFDFFLVCYILPSFKEFVPEFNYSKVYQLDKLKLTALKELWVLLAHLVLELPSRFTLRLITHRTLTYLMVLFLMTRSDESKIRSG